MDQGGEFEREWLMMLENYGIFSTTTGSHAGWQHAFAERHGGLLGTTWQALVVETRAESHQDMAIALAGAIDAKNELVTRQGYSPNMLVFGKQVSFPELLGEQEYDPVTQAQSLNLDTEFAKRATTRHQARQILLRDDVQQKLKRALTRKPANRDYIYMPGDVIYFFVPNPMKPRYRKDHGRWRGPAVVILQEAHQRYFVSWRGRCLLLAAPNMRLASSEEVGCKENVQEELKGLSEKMSNVDEKKDYEDLVQSMSQAEPETQPVVSRNEDRALQLSQDARRMMAGLKSVRKLMERSQWLKSKQMLAMGQPRRPPRKRRTRALTDVPPPGALQDGPAEDEMNDAELERFWSEVAAQEDQYVRDDQQRQQRRRELLDDFPRAALKRKGPEEPEGELAKRLRADFYAMVMLAVSARDLPPHKQPRVEDVLGASGKSNEWLTRSEVRSMRKLLDLPHRSSQDVGAASEEGTRPSECSLGRNAWACFAGAGDCGGGATEA